MKLVSVKSGSGFDWKDTLRWAEEHVGGEEACVWKFGCAVKGEGHSWREGGAGTWDEPVCVFPCPVRSEGRRRGWRWWREVDAM